jgi:hypothetical protein
MHVPCCGTADTTVGRGDLWSRRKWFEKLRVVRNRRCVRKSCACRYHGDDNPLVKRSGVSRWDEEWSRQGK